MQVRCIHCSHRFDHQPPAFARGGGSTVCPSCGLDTPASEEWASEGGFGGGAAIESRVYCFNCGKAMTPREGELIPVCDECRRDQAVDEGPAGGAPSPDEPVADWMIRKANGNVYGPFPNETIVEWIRSRKINPDEEVAHIGGAWRLFGQHEEFGKYFDKPSESVPIPNQDLDFRRRSPVREFMGRAGGLVVGVAVLGAVAVGVWYAISNHALVIPQDTLERVADRVGDLGGDRQASGAAMSQDAKSLLLELIERHKGVQGSSMEHFLRGRTLMLRDNYDNLVLARDALEKAVVLDPRNGLALAALAELYNLLAWSGYESLDLQRQSIYLVQIAEAVGDYPAAVLRSKASFLVYSGNFAEGSAAAEAALQKNPDDPALHYLLGIAAMGGRVEVTPAVQAHFDKAIELDPRFHQVWFALADAEEKAGHLDKAIAHYERKLSTDPRSSASHARLGAIHQRVGDYVNAAKHYEAAIAINIRERDAVLSRAVLAYQVEANPSRAVTLLQGLLEADGPELRIGERKTIGTHLAAAQLQAGQPQAANDAADAVIAKDRIYGPAHFQKALALVALGRPGDAVPEFTKAEDSGLDPRELSRILFFAGWAAWQGERLQEAAEAFRRGRDVDARYTPNWLWAAAVTARLGEGSVAAEALLEHIKSDPLEYARDRDFGEWWAPVPPPAPLVQGMSEALGTESFAPAIYAALGIGQFHSGAFQEADASLKKSSSQDERGAAALFYRGLIEHRQGRAAAAAALFTGVLDVTRNSGVVHIYLADAQLAQGRVDEALASFERGMAYGGKSPWSLTRMAAALAAAGKPEQAAEKLAEAEIDDPKSVVPRKARFERKS